MILLESFSVFPSRSPSEIFCTEFTLWRHQSAFGIAALFSRLHHDILTHPCVVLQYLFHEMAIDEDFCGGYLQPYHS